MIFLIIAIKLVFTRLFSIDSRCTQEQASEKEEHQEIRGGVFNQDQDTPFGFGRGEGADAGSMNSDWIVGRDKEEYDKIFQTLNLNADGKLSGSDAKPEMAKSKLPNSVLAKIWKLADVDKDGLLDSDEFALSMHLMKIKVNGFDLPATLPEHLVPPSKRE